MLDLCSTSESRACGSARELNGSSLQPMSLPPLGTTPSTARVESRLLRLEPQAQVLLDVAWKAWRGPDPRCGRSVASGVSSESTRRIFVMHCSVRPSSTSRLLLAMKMAECIAYVPKIAIHFQVQSWALEPHCTDCPTLVHVATGAAEGVFLIWEDRAKSGCLIYSGGKRGLSGSVWLYDDQKLWYRHRLTVPTQTLP